MYLSCNNKKKKKNTTYIEGITLNFKSPKGTTFVDVGLKTPILISTPIIPDVRVTVQLNDPAHALQVSSTTTSIALKPPSRAELAPTGTVVSPWVPRTEHGIYWGYQTRLAASISEVLSGCPFGNETGKKRTETNGETGSKRKEIHDDDDNEEEEEQEEEDDDNLERNTDQGKYDFTIGVSDRVDVGLVEELQTKIRNLQSSTSSPSSNSTNTNSLPFNHVLVVIGGTKGLEYSVGVE